MKAFLKNKELKALIKTKQAFFGPYTFNSNPNMKPIKWIGT
jgi:hypothetical protein